MQQLAHGQITKMKTTLATPVTYHLPVGDQLIDMSALIGKPLQLEHTSEIHCTHCGRLTKKSFSQGYCFPCMRSLAQCDVCIMSPEKCHYAAGTCREPEWGETHCMIDHVVYLSNASGLKVGITRATQVPTRWIDQGAIQALPILQVATRHLSGLAEVLFKQHVSDRTQWQRMLKNDVMPMDLEVERDRLFSLISDELAALDAEHPGQIKALKTAAAVSIKYPVLEYPTKVKSFNLDKTPVVSGTLMGIKGQYLIFDNGVINLRKYTGYDLVVSAIKP